MKKIIILGLGLMVSSNAMAFYDTGFSTPESTFKNRNEVPVLEQLEQQRFNQQMREIEIYNRHWESRHCSANELMQVSCY